MQGSQVIQDFLHINFMQDLRTCTTRLNRALHCSLCLPRDMRRRSGAPSGQEDHEWSPSGSEGPQGSPHADLRRAGRSLPPGNNPAGPPHIIADSSDNEGSAGPPGRQLAAGSHAVSDSPDDEGCGQAASKRARQAGDPDSSSRVLTARSSLGGLQDGATGGADPQAAPPAMRLAELRERAHATGSAAGRTISARVHGHIQTLLGGLVFRDEEGRPTSEYFLELTVADDGGDEADATVSSALLHSLLGAPRDAKDECWQQ